MFGFLVKKAFFDMWDNLFRILLMNLGYIALFAWFFLLVPLFSAVPLLLFAAAAIGILLFAVYSGAVSRMCSEISDYRQPGFA
jgi:hypothetical protein